MNETATLPTPGWRGRGVRLGLAALCFYLFAQIIGGNESVWLNAEQIAGSRGVLSAAIVDGV